MTRLCSETLHLLPSPLERPNPSHAHLHTKIMHFGLGAFARCHLLDYLARLGDEAWGVLGVSLRSTAQKTLLAPQDYLYTTLNQSEDGVRAQVIAVLKGILVAPQEQEAVLAALASPETAIVSLTITEKGYCFNGATGRLERAHPDIIHDLANPRTPRSALGYLVEGLRLRQAAGFMPFTVLCCDNLTQNGARVKALVCELAQVQSPALATWIAQHGAFPSTMVDRIVPAQTPAVKAQAFALHGLEDEAALAHESFCQWVIEDNFVDNNRPPFEKVGVEIVQDVTPFEAMKLKMLNGAHSAIAYLGQVYGLETVAQVMGIAAHRQYIWQLWAEIMPFIEGVKGKELQDYAMALEKRFLNPHLHHKTAQIAMDGSQKLPPRLLHTLMARRAKNLASPALSRAIALWMYYVCAFEINDPLAAMIKAATKNQDPVGALLALEAIFPKILSEDEAWRREVRAAFSAVSDQLTS
jgi:fructuronate reductase